MSPSNELWLGILIAVVNKFQNNQWKNELLNYTEYVQLYMVHNPNAQHHISAMLTKLYIPSTINIWKKVLTKAIWADKKWARFLQISLYITLVHQVKLKH